LAAPLVAVNVNAQAFSTGSDAIDYRQGAVQIIKAHFEARQPVARGWVACDRVAEIDSRNRANDAWGK
jgi:hypothetical protein